MSNQAVFKEQLRNAAPEEGSARRWIFVPHDQLSDRIGPLSRLDPKEIGIILIESAAWARRRPYHKQKLALVWTNQRWFAIEQARRGVAVRYLPTRRSFGAVLREQVAEIGPIRMMEAAEREMRVDLQPLVDEALLEILPHEGWLTTRGDFEQSIGKTLPYRMDSFYRVVRKRTGILMEDGKPVGGKLSHDADNREKWPGHPPAPRPPAFPSDAIKEEVCRFVERDYADHPGSTDLMHLPATQRDAEALWKWAACECMESFGPYEDAMSVRSSGLFHTRISSLMNIHRILPRDVVADVASMRIPLNSKEGFIRQVIGWREFVYHVHRATDGFRSLSGELQAVLESSGDGGWSIWSGRHWDSDSGDDVGDGGSDASFLDAREPLPRAYWGGETGLACLDTVIEDVWREGWSHHITRLMVLSNIATLLDTSPRQLTDWFWAAYTDAWDWVVEPNVMAMGTYGVGGVMTTKPYIAGAAYIDKMGDFCATCTFNPKTDCPITRLYWAFLARHSDKLEGNQRLAMPLNSLRRRPDVQRRHDERVFDIVRSALAEGHRLAPDDLPQPPKGPKAR